MLGRATLALLAGSAAAAPARHHAKATLQLDDTAAAPSKFPFEGFRGSDMYGNASYLYGSDALNGCEASECEESHQCKTWNGMPDPNDVSEQQCGVFWFLHIEKNAGTVVTWRMQEYSQNLMQGNEAPENSKLGKYTNSKWVYHDIMAPEDWDMNPDGDKSNWYWKNSDDWKSFEQNIEKDKPNEMLHWHWGAAPFSEMVDNGFVHDLACKMKRKGCELRIAAILREPMSRTISKIGFDQVAKSDFYNFMNFDSNPQAKYMVYNDETHWPESLWEFDMSNPGRDDWVLNKAWDMVKYFDAIGKSEDVLKMLNYVELSLGFDWTKELPQTTETSNPSSLQYDLSEADYNFIRPHLSIDSKLYWSFCKDGHRAKQYRCPAE